jgi:hypothetical protein
MIRCIGAALIGLLLPGCSQQSQFERDFMKACMTSSNKKVCSCAFEGVKQEIGIERALEIEAAVVMNRPGSKQMLKEYFEKSNEIGLACRQKHG